jgi:hypothetical protein
LLLFGFAAVDGRRVVAAFDGEAITSDAGALLLGETNRAIRLTSRFAVCFTDARVAKLVGRRSAPWCCSGFVGISLSYEDLSDHDELRHSV